MDIVIYEGENEVMRFGLVDSRTISNLKYKKGFKIGCEEKLFISSELSEVQDE